MRSKLMGRLLAGVGLVFSVITLTFLLINLAPGDPARLWVGPGAGEAELEAARRALGLDRSLLVRYVTWVGRFVTGDWGTSFAQQRAVTQIIRDALPHTIVLSAGSLVITYVGSIILGLFQAARARTGWDRSLSVASLFTFGMPAYWLAAMLVMIFAYASSRYGWPAMFQLPALGVTAIDSEYLTFVGRLNDRIRHMVLPLATLAIIGIAGTSRFVRGSVLDIRNQSFVKSARARGLRTWGIEIRYVLRNALAPIVTLAGLSLPALFSGTVFVEVVFAWPGMGREIVGAVTSRDYPVVMATTAIFAALVVIGNLLADVANGLIDPRVEQHEA